MHYPGQFATEAPVANSYIERWLGCYAANCSTGRPSGTSHNSNDSSSSTLLITTSRLHRPLDEHPPVTKTVLPFRPRSPVTVTARCNGLIHEYEQAA